MGEIPLYPTTLVFLITMLVLIFKLRRPYAFVPLFITAIYIPLYVSVVLGGVHFMLFRIIMIAGWIRLAVRGENRFTLNGLDRLFIVWAIVCMIFGILTELTPARLINRVGYSVDALGLYFFARCVVRDKNDFICCLRALALILAPLVIFFLFERFQQRSYICYLTGMAEKIWIRNDTVRCKGIFVNPITPGTLGAILFPLFLSLCLRPGPDRTRARFGAIMATAVVYLSRSSGPLMAYMTACLGWFFWWHKKKLRPFLFAVIAFFICLDIVMNAPIWYLIARVGDVTGGTAYHRAYLIDQAVKHINEWWLVGTTYTAHWGPGGEVLEINANSMDITNHYILEGIDGGLLKLGLFFAIVIICFRSVSAFIKKSSDEHHRLLVWGTGVSFASHCVSFISISYFDQMAIIWYWALATVSALTAVSTASAPSAVEVEEPKSVATPAPRYFLNLNS